MDKPLISFVIWCYNQEAYTREAVEAALAQDYSQLEIIISDDCSNDRTFEVIREVTAAYKGRHKLVVNRNARNLGIGGNLSRAMELCRGELLVMAGGDDISLPERTTRIVEAWNDSGRRATTLYSGFTVIDEHGQPKNGVFEDSFAKEKERFVHEKATALRFARRRQPAFCGCAHAVSPKLYSLFGALPERICAEDTALAFRTALLGGLFTFINAPLVEYRWHGANTSAGVHQLRPRDTASFREVQHKKRVELERMAGLYQCFATDAQRAVGQGLISSGEYAALSKCIRREGRRFELRSELLAQPWLRRFFIFCKLYGSAIRPRELLEQSPHLLPRAVYRAVVITRNSIRSCNM